MSDDRLAGAPPEIVEAYQRLTARQRALAFALPTARTQEEAALQAGYSPKTARATAHRQASAPDVVLVTQYLIGSAVKAAELTIEQCMRELAKLVGADPQMIFDENGALLPPDKWPEGAGAAITEVQQADIYEGYGEDREKVGVTNKIRFVDKSSALNLAFKLLGAFPEKKQTVTHRVGVVVVPQKNITQQNADALEGQSRRIEQPKPKGNAPSFVVKRVRALAAE